MGNNLIFPTTKGILRKLGGDKISGKVLTWDGDFDDTENIMGTIDACKITDKYMDLNSVESLVVKYENGNTKTLTASECMVYTDMGVQVLMPVEEEFPYVSSSPADVEGLMNKGLYFAWTPEFHVEKITFAKTIVPIDPKYLPNKVLDLDAMGLTPYVLELANQGGGRTYLHSNKVDIVETIYNKFPKSWDFAAKLTILEPDSMYVSPVYTTFNEDGYNMAHFDSYLLTNQETMSKFFVRISRYTSNNNIEGLVKVIDIHVGFYT